MKDRETGKKNEKKKEGEDDWRKNKTQSER